MLVTLTSSHLIILHVSNPDWAYIDLHLSSSSVTLCTCYRVSRPDIVTLAMV